MRKLILGLLLASIGLAAPTAMPMAAASRPTTTPAPSPAILVLGDSVSAGYGLRGDQGWAILLQQKLKAQGYGYQVINASVSGETTAGGLARLPRALAEHRPAVVIIELGGNDGLRALPVAQMRANLMRMVSLSQQAKASVLLVGMRMPPNYGARYTAQFHQVYEDVAQYFRIPLVPFLLEGVATNEALMQADGIHPNAAGQPRLLETVWPTLVRMLTK